MDLDISYKQFAICNYNEEKPFSDWTEKHVEQGFTLRPQAIGIMTFEADCRLDVRIDMTNNFLENYSRIFVFPFEVKGNKGVEVASIGSSIDYNIPDGEYSLIIQLLEKVDSTSCILSFVNKSELDNTPRVVKADNVIIRKVDLILDAKEA